MAISHPQYPKGLGISIKFYHGWDGEATGFIAQNILTSLGFSISQLSWPGDQNVYINQETLPGENGWEEVQKTE
jgi:hypothetical protein